MFQLRFLLINNESHLDIVIIFGWNSKDVCYLGLTIKSGINHVKYLNILLATEVGLAQTY